MSEECPKCGREKTGPSCPKCGVVFDRFDPSALEEGASASLKDLWHHTVENWDKPASHALFIERALQESQAGYAAACYRTKGEDAIAKVHLEALTKRLEQSLLVTRSDRSEPKPVSRYALAFALLLLGATVAFLLMR